MGVSNTLDAQDNSDHAIDLKLSKISTNSIKLDSLLAWSEYSENTSISDAIKIGKKGSALAKDLNLADRIAAFDDVLGNAYTDFGNQDSALYHFNKAIEFHESSNNQLKIAAIYNRQIRLYINSGNYDKAYLSGNKALKIYESLGESSLIGETLVDLSDVFYYQERYQEGVDLGLRALKEFSTLKDSLAISFAYQIVSGNYHGLGDKESAFEYADKAVKLQRRLGGDLLSLGSVVNNRGDVLKDMARYEEALRDFKESNAIATQFNHAGGIAATNSNIANVYFRMGQYAKALPLKLESVAMLEQSGFSSNLMMNYKQVATIYEKLNQPTVALAYYKKYSITRDSSLSAEKDKITFELLTQYETEKKESTITLQNQEIAQQKTTQRIFIGFLSLLGILLAVLYKNFKNKQQLNQQLQVTNDALDTKNQQNELLLKEIHHRVKNNLQTISSLLSLQSNSIKDSNALDAVQQSRNRVASMALIHQKLYQGENLAAIEMQDYFQTIGHSIINGFGAMAKTVELKVDMPKIELDVDTAIPIGLITNELITNSLKYAFDKKEHGKISISMEKVKDNLIQFKIADNGQHKTIAISKGGTGFGSMLVQLLTTQLGGQLEQLTTNGTVTIIKFPVTP